MLLEYILLHVYGDALKQSSEDFGFINKLLMQNFLNIVAI